MRVISNNFRLNYFFDTIFLSCFLKILQCLFLSENCDQMRVVAVDFGVAILVTVVAYLELYSMGLLVEYGTVYFGGQSDLVWITRVG